MRQIKHWQDAANAVIGVGLILSPWALGYAAESAPTVNAVIAGVALLAAALGAMLTPRAWEEWAEALLGAWLVVSPWLPGFAAGEVARNVAVATGLATVVLGLWTLVTDKDYNVFKRSSKAQ
jgi:hypothetical protein